MFYICCVCVFTNANTHSVHMFWSSAVCFSTFFWFAAVCWFCFCVQSSQDKQQKSVREGCKQQDEQLRAPMCSNFETSFFTLPYVMFVSGKLGFHKMVQKYLQRVFHNKFLQNILLSVFIYTVRNGVILFAGSGFHLLFERLYFVHFLLMYSQKATLRLFLFYFFICSWQHWWRKKTLYRCQQERAPATFIRLTPDHTVNHDTLVSR